MVFLLGKRHFKPRRNLRSIAGGHGVKVVAASTTAGRGMARVAYSGSLTRRAGFDQEDAEDGDENVSSLGTPRIRDPDKVVQVAGTRRKPREVRPQGSCASYEGDGENARKAHNGRR